jgi:hypothetical protein
MIDPLLRRNLIYEVVDTLDSTKTKIGKLLQQYDSGKMDEEGIFTYRANFMFSPRIFNSNKNQVVYGKGWLEADGKNTIIHFTISPNIGLVFLVLIILPLLGLNAFFGDHSMMNIPGFLLTEGFFISAILIGTILLKRNFENKFDLTSGNSKKR